MIAPSCWAARRLADPHRPVQRWINSFRLTSSDRLQRFIAQHVEAALGRRAAYHMRRTLPVFSNAAPLHIGKSVAAATIAILVLTTLAFYPATTIGIFSVLLCAIFLAAAALRLSSALYKQPAPERPFRGSDRELPIYTIICALYREEKVVNKLVAAIRALDYPGIMAQTVEASDGPRLHVPCMADSRTAETLRNKRDEIARSIDDYEARLAQAKADLAHIDAAIAIFATSDGQKPVRPYVDIHRLFKRGELGAISREALKDGPRNTRELAQAVMAAKGLDTGDKRAGEGRILSADPRAADTGPDWQDCRGRKAQSGKNMAAAGLVGLVSRPCRRQPISQLKTDAPQSMRGIASALAR